MNINALFLAGGMGKRLQPLTDWYPKPMVPIMGKPLIERNINRLKSYGIDDITLSICYKPETILRHFGNGEKYGLHIHYAFEEKPLGTGGAIKNSAKFLNNTFLVFNADIMCDIDYEEMVRFHKQKKADVTIAVTWVKDPTTYGVIEYDRDYYATSFTEKPPADQVKSHFINAGIYIFEKSVLDTIPLGQAVSVERETFPNLLKNGGKIAVYDGCKYWLDIGTPEKYMQAQYDIFNGMYTIDEADFTKKNIFKGHRVKGFDHAFIRGPVYLGENVQIGFGASIGPNVVIGANSTIGKNSIISNSVIWSDVAVKSEIQMLDVVMINNKNVTSSVYT